VLDHHHGDGARQRADHPRDPLALARREPGTRLVEEQDPGVRVQREGQFELPALAVGEEPRGLLGSVGEPDGAEALAGAVRASAAKWAADPRLSEFGYVPGDMRASEASYLESLGKEADAKAAWSAAADAYGADAKASKLKVARGANLERAYCLAKAGRLAEARALYDSLVGAYPDEFTFQYGYARLLLEQKELPAALISARAAAKSGYGDNWLRAVGLEAKILKAMGLKEEAAKSLDAALAEAAAPKSAAVRTHRYLAELRRLRSEL